MAHDNEQAEMAFLKRVIASRDREIAALKQTISRHKSIQKLTELALAREDAEKRWKRAYIFERCGVEVPSDLADVAREKPSEAE